MYKGIYICLMSSEVREGLACEAIRRVHILDIHVGPPSVRYVGYGFTELGPAKRRLLLSVACGLVFGVLRHSSIESL